mmetsp:Transcript_39452/g.77763  ORF Transcript_39452/g.77763 Transcript_39452/m.77763 type:complete len:338 (+) Transcript_39452:208-1221(+)
MDLPNAIYDGEETFSTGAHIGFGKMVPVVDRLLRSRAGMSSAESANPWVDLMATIVSPSTEEAAVIARAHVAFPWVRLHAIRVSSYYPAGERTALQPLVHRFVAESSCFEDDGQDQEEDEDCSTNPHSVQPWLTWAPEIYFGAAAGSMPGNKEELAVEATSGQGPKTSEDKKKIGATTSTKSPSQVNRFTFSLMPSSALKPSPAASNSIGLVNALRVLLTFGPDAAGTFKWPPGPGTVGTSAWLPDPGKARTSARPPDPGKVGASAWPPDPGEVGTSAWPPDPGDRGTSAWPPDPGEVGTSAWPRDLGATGASMCPPDPGEVGGFMFPPDPGCCFGA